MVYDAEDGYVLFFGVAATDHGFLDGGQTWILDGQNWTNLTPTLSASPPGLQRAGLVDDQQDGYVVLFGGFEPAALNISGHPQFTWTFHAGQWTDRTATSGVAPPGEYGPAMTYDASAGYVLLAAFNRSPAGTSEFETWRYSGGLWANISGQVGTQPGAREQSALVYDPSDGESILFGGEFVADYTNAYTYNDTWAFRAGNWWNVTTPGSPSPPAVSGPGSAFTEGGHVLLFGGYSGQSCAPTGAYNCSSAATWVFLNGTWFNMSLELPGWPRGPAIVSEPNMVWDPNLSAVLLVSGGPRTVWTLRWNSSAVLPALAIWRPGAPPGVAIPFTVAPLGGSPAYNVSVCAENSTCVSWTSLPNSTPLSGSVQFATVGIHVIYAHVVDANGSAATFGFRVPVFNSDGPLGISFQVDPDAGFSPLNVSLWVNISGGAHPVLTDVYFGDGVDQTFGPGSFVVYHNYTCSLPAGTSGQAFASCGYEAWAVAHDAIGQGAAAPGVPLNVCASNVNGSLCYPPPGEGHPGGNRPLPSSLATFSGLAFLLGGCGLVVFSGESHRRANRLRDARSLSEELVRSVSPPVKVAPGPSREPPR